MCLDWVGKRKGQQIQNLWFLAQETQVEQLDFVVENARNVEIVKGEG